MSLFERLRGSNPYEQADQELPISEHLGELRDRILYSVLAITVCACLGFYFAFEIIAFLMVPLKTAMAGFPITAQLHFTSITEPLFQSFKIALFAGIGMAFPFWVWQIWKFVAPGLYSNEKRLVTPFIASSSILFLLGAAFAYTIAVPLAYRFLLLYANPYYQAASTKGAPHIVLEAVPKRPLLRHVPPTKRGPSAPSTQPTTPAKRPAPPAKTKTLPALRASSDGILPIRFEWTPHPKHKQGWKIKLTSPLPANQMSPSGLLRQLQKQKGVELHLHKGKQRQVFRIKYEWPRPKSRLAGGLLKPILTLQAYLSLSSWFLLGFGLIFQTPLIILLLTSSGLVSPDLLRKYRRHAFVAILLIAAILTPTGDPVNLMIMALPMYILFEIGLWLSTVLKLQKKPAEPTPSTDE